MPNDVEQRIDAADEIALCRSQVSNLRNFSSLYMINLHAVDFT